jgi:hypothetical protein
MEDAARNAGAHLATLQVELRAKVKAENDYYDATRASVVRAIERAREDDLLNQLESQGASFVSTSRSSNAPRQIAGRLQQQMTTFSRTWSQREAQRDALVEGTLKQLDQNRKALKLAEAEYKTLQTKLRSLSQARSTGEAISFAVGFVKGLQESLDEAREQAKAADAAAERATEELQTESSRDPGGDPGR